MMTMTEWLKECNGRRPRRARTTILRFYQSDYEEWLAAMKAAEKAATNGCAFYAADRFAHPRAQIGLAVYLPHAKITGYWCAYVLDGEVHTQFGNIRRTDRKHNPMTERNYRALCHYQPSRTSCPVRIPAE